MTGRLDEIIKYIELNKTSANNNDIDKILIKKKQNNYSKKQNYLRYMVQVKSQ